ncbi:MAG TPA: sigma-E factor negative regulatory protein [Gammaproteobacteria bacterium]
MSEQIHDQVSAFVDDELSPEESAFLVRRLERDPESRNKLVRYSLIGSALRGDLIAPDPEALRRRVHEALSGTPLPSRAPAVAGPPPTAVASRWSNPAVGLGVAAGVAVAALFTFRAVNDVGDADAFGATQASAAGAASYVVPADSPDTVVAPPPIRLTNYLMHHSEYASRLSRTSVSSNVVGAMDAPLLFESIVVTDTPAAAEVERDVQ